MNKSYPYQKIFCYILVILASASAVLFGIFVFFETQTDLDSHIPQDAVFFIHIKKPFFPFKESYGKTIPPFLNIEEIFGERKIFEKEIYPSLSDEIAFVYLEPDAEAPLIFLETKSIAQIQPYFSQYRSQSLGGSKYAFIPESLESFELKETMRFTQKNGVSKRVGGARFYLNLEKIKNILSQKPLGIMPFAGLAELTGFIKFSQGTWKFSAYPNTSFSAPQNSASLPRQYLNALERDTFFAKGVQKNYLKQFISSAEIRALGQRYFYENISDAMSESFDFALDLNQEDSPLFLLSSEVKNFDEEEFIAVLKKWLSYIYPLKLEKTLADGTGVLEEIADENSLVAEYKTARVKVLHIPHEKKSFVVFFDRGRFIFGNDLAYLLEHTKSLQAARARTAAGFCDDKNFSQVFLYAPREQDFSAFEFLKFFKKDIRIFFSAQQRFLNGCIL